MERHGPDRMVTAVTASMAARTGRTVEEWVELVQASGTDPLDQNAVRRWLKSEHGVPMNSAYAIADAAARRAGWVEPTLEEYISSQYEGPRAALRPLFDALRSFIEGLGPDVATEGRNSYTPFVRRRQFAAIAAATRTRIDVGLRFTDAPASDLLTPSAAPGQATHRLSLVTLDDITPEVEALIRTAYEQNR